MKLHTDWVILICIWFCFCDGPSDVSGMHGSNVSPNTTTVSSCFQFCDCIHGHEDKQHCLCKDTQYDNQTYQHCLRACNCDSNVPSQTKKHMSTKVAIGILVACVIMIIMAASFYFFCKFCKEQEESSALLHSNNDGIELTSYPDISQTPAIGHSQRDSITRMDRGINAKRLSYVELARATNHFADYNMIGSGGSSNVYRGQLNDGISLAVKRLKAHGISDDDSRYLTEVQFMSKLNHPNIMPLLGYCGERVGNAIERLLVFPYMANGTLRHCLCAPEVKDLLDWKTRVNIALGIAKGIEYLHEVAKIMHQDIKSANILLDHEYTAKITDFDLAKSLTENEDDHYTSSPLQIRGTFGYMAPEYVTNGEGTVKSDVYSLGVVILELVTGRVLFEGNEHLLFWATPRLQDDTMIMTEIPDNHFKGKFSKEGMKLLADLIKDCITFGPEFRPSASEVVQALSIIASLEE